MRVIDFLWAALVPIMNLLPHPKWDSVIFHYYGTGSTHIIVYFVYLLVVLLVDIQGVLWFCAR